VLLAVYCRCDFSLLMHEWDAPSSVRVVWKFLRECRTSIEQRIQSTEDSSSILRTPNLEPRMRCVCWLHLVEVMVVRSQRLVKHDGDCPPAPVTRVPAVKSRWILGRRLKPQAWHLAPMVTTSNFPESGGLLPHAYPYGVLRPGTEYSHHLPPARLSLSSKHTCTALVSPRK